MSLIGCDLSQYPLDKQYEDCQQYICSMDWDKISDDIRASGTVGVDVSDAINSFSHLELDPQYRLICYTAKEYHGIFGRVKAVKKTDEWNPPCDADQEDTAHSSKDTLRLPECVFSSMEAVYNDGTGEGYFEAVLFSQFIQALPYTCFAQNRWPHIINTMPEKYDENWECQVALADWSPRYSKHTITALCHKFENGIGASDGKDRIYLTQFDFCNIVFTILFALSFNVMAHEFSPSRYWNDIYFNSSTRKHIVRLKINISNVTNSVYNRTLRTAISNWELYGDGYCDTEITTTGTNIMVYDTYPATQNQNAYAVTVSTISNATIYEYPYGITGGSTAKSCKKITKAKVYVNRSKQSADSFSENDITKTWAHELGHVIGFNETNDGTQTVMRQGKGSTFGWSNYWRPQTHDTTDLSRYRYVSWS